MLAHALKNVFSAKKAALALFLGASALLLALQPLALQAHIAMESASACCGHACETQQGGAAHHDSATCPTCELLGLLSSAQTDLAGLDGATAVERLFEKPLASASEARPGEAALFMRALPRAPPAENL